jgi:hypothetical protein
MPWAGVMFLGKLKANKGEIHRLVAATGTGYSVEFLCVLS